MPAAELDDHGPVEQDGCCDHFGPERGLQAQLVGTPRAARGVS